jgi:dienelactone hydrolase
MAALCDRRTVIVGLRSMSVFNRLIVVLVALLAAQGLARAEGPDALIWCQWETGEVEKLGPEEAAGVLFYFHGYVGRRDTTALPIPQIFTTMAKAAKWNVIRVNRHHEADLEVDDGRILEVVSSRVAEARREGYRYVVLAGWSRGGWLALTAATLDRVDAVVGIAPGVGGASTAELEGTRDRLAQRLRQAKAPRIAAFFFDGDWLEDVPERRAIVIRRALQSTRSTFMVVDRPFDFYGHGGGRANAFDEKYGDCLVRFAQAADRPGEVRCPFGDPTAMPSPPPNSSPQLAAYWGRWEGFDQSNAWLTLRSTGLSSRHIHFDLVHSPRPGTGFEQLTGEKICELDASDGSIYCPLQYDVLAANLKSPDELVLRRLQRGPTSPGTILRKRTEEADAGRGHP